eukprot:CAMPEP_0182432716 /NCGR_PEP_ID=MMETSP1167-20130531/58401_1 /TAXON_ID=2988 /ORGANISM="Mallomonas Sp, Strain CCMP3275" /LENGTH=126 /DNA_ID=CAMNT_0024620555 /DNA_START=141 /DNA_END=517 /DNA_ORIENTATION=+
MKKLRADLKSFATRLDDLTDRLAQAEVTVKEGRKQANKAMLSKNRSSKELTKWENKLVELQEAGVELERERESVLLLLQEAKGLAESQESELKEKKTVYDKMTEELAVVVKTIEDITSYISEADKA